MVALAQVNVGQLRFAVDAPELAEFVRAVDRINQLADHAPGFIWRDPDAHRHLQGGATPTGPVTIVNLSVWENYETLHEFVYRSVHGGLVRRRDEWFNRLPPPTTALWWVSDADRPTTTDALARLTHLRRHGPTPRVGTGSMLMAARSAPADDQARPRRKACSSDDYPGGPPVPGRPRSWPVSDENKAAQAEITAFWNMVGPRYDSPDNVATPDTPAYASWFEALRTVLPTAPAQILDVGTGTGFLARLAAEQGHTVSAIDLSPAMLKASTASGPGTGITFAVGDAVAPTFPAESFDAVVSRSLIWTLREPARAFGNWWTLLRPGGRVVAIFGLTPAEATAGNGPYTAQTRAQLPAMHLADHEVLVRIATAAGFRGVRAIALDALRGWETSPGSDLPYALVGYRTPEQQATTPRRPDAQG